MVKQSPLMWDLGTCAALFVSKLSSGVEIITKSALHLHCVFKNHFHIHYFIRSSGSLKVDNGLTCTLTNLFEESSQ